MIKKMDTKYTDIGCLDIPKLWYTYRKRCGNEGELLLYMFAYRVYWKKN